MRLGRVYATFGYVVDLDDKDMVEHAKTATEEDISNAAKFDELDANIDVKEDPDAKEEDIAEWLR